MITPCKMRLPEKDRAEISRRVQEALFADGGSWHAGQREVLNTNDGYLFIAEGREGTLTCSCEDGYFSRNPLPEIDPLDFLRKYEFKKDYKDYGVTHARSDATEILEQLVAEPDDANLQMKTKDARNLFEREQVYADSQVKKEPEQKRIIYIDDRPMSHRMGWGR